MFDWRSFLVWLEGSALGQSVRDLGVWSYGTINLFHIVGIATLFGSVLVLDLRLLGWRRGIPLASVVSATVPISILGFTIAAISGVCLLATNATEYLGNPFLPIKFAAIALALLNALVVSRMRAWRSQDAESSSAQALQLKIGGGVSLLAWLSAVAAGRMIAYW